MSDNKNDETGCDFFGYQDWKKVRAEWGFSGLDPEMGPKDEDEYDPTLDWRVHSIITHRSSISDNTPVEFLVKWWPVSGQDGQVYIWPDSWVKEADLDNCDQLKAAYFAKGGNQPVSAPETPGIGATGISKLSSQPYYRSEGYFGSSVSLIVAEFSKLGFYSINGGLRHPTNPKLNPLVGFDFIQKVFDKALALENDQIYLLPYAVGKITTTKKLLNSYRKTVLVPFRKPSQASIDLAGALNNGYKSAIFLVLSRKGLIGSHADFHCNVGIITNKETRQFFCFNTTTKPNVMAHPPMDLDAVIEGLCSKPTIMMGYGTQSNTADCIERALHFIGIVVDGGNWKDFSPTGWSPFIKRH